MAAGFFQNVFVEPNLRPLDMISIIYLTLAYNLDNLLRTDPLAGGGGSTAS